MAGEKTVRLSRCYEAHGRTFDAITLRAPVMADFEAIGEIAETQPAPGGGSMIISHDDRIWKYRDRLMKTGADLPSSTDIDQLDLVDAMAVKEAVTDFFAQARGKSSRNAPSEGQQTF